MDLQAMMGLPALGARDGDIIGTISGWLLDPANRRVACLLIDTGNWYDSAHGLRFDCVLGIGDGAVIAGERAEVVPISSDPSLLSAAQKRLTGIGAPLYTPVGKCLGNAAGIDVTERGAIISITTDGGEVISERRIMVMGRVFLISQSEDDIPKHVQAANPERPGQQVVVKSNVGNPIIIKTPPPPEI